MVEDIFDGLDHRPRRYYTLLDSIALLLHEFAVDDAVERGDEALEPLSELGQEGSSIYFDRAYRLLAALEAEGVDVEA